MTRTASWECTYVREDSHFFGQALGGVQALGGGACQSCRQRVHVLSQDETGLPCLKATRRGHVTDTTRHHGTISSSSGGSQDRVRESPANNTSKFSQNALSLHSVHQVTSCQFCQHTVNCRRRYEQRRLNVVWSPNERDGKTQRCY